MRRQIGREYFEDASGFSSWGEDVVAGRTESFDRIEFGELSSGAAASEYGDHVDGLGNERARHGDHGFLDELFQPAQRADRRTRMQRADAAGMAGAPGFQKIERLGPAYLADRD